MALPPLTEGPVSVLNWLTELKLVASENKYEWRNDDSLHEVVNLPSRIRHFFLI